MGNARDYLDRCFSLAVVGGTFDPIHRGHLAIGEAVRRRFSPQRVLYVPCGQPSHKEGADARSAEHRYRMTLLATCDHPFFDVSRIEIDRPGESYTIDTVRHLQGLCPAGAELYFVMGADSLEQILAWKDAEELLRLCHFIAVPRPGYGRKHTIARINALNDRFGERIFFLDMPKIEVSSTEVRRRFSKGERVRDLIPRAVEEYARARNLYGGPASFDEVKTALQQRLSPKRFVHTLGVLKEADKLARHYGADVEKARWAALLHDCAKEYSTDKKRALCEKWGIALDAMAASMIDLTHGPIGAESARRDYGVTDTEILQAIRYHSTGHGGMTVLDKVIILADYIEPYREDYPPLAQMRALAYTDMNKALRVGIKYTIKEETQAGNPVHPDSHDALAALKK
ncbi:MAG: nicotinate-nucleotide adenylyltransferase [Defluviitaleaceae bacterium]|nr:nicotinate-nucleotide adenylyltransferase [Defluviitaleaceae bacterium]MCL2240487.1 nicotinate-nucleotide adenylyltransferase [Defluviitaleaceae bacterium]